MATTSFTPIPFLVCTRAHESDTAGGYRAISPGGTYRGAYQFLRSTWDNVARHAGRSDLVGVDPAAASPADQDLLAWDLYQWQGAAPWVSTPASFMPATSSQLKPSRRSITRTRRVT